MLSTVREKKLLLVRWVLLAGWLLLGISLVWNPLASPATAGAATDLAVVMVQGQPLALAPFAWGPHLFWTVVIPAIPLFLMVAGHEAWRRICPLSLLSQIPRMLGLQRRRLSLNRRTGALERVVPLPLRDGRWREHAPKIQFGLLFAGLAVRILFVNSDRVALAVFFGLVAASALTVGALWGGKTWCNYICPLGVVQKVYTGPGGLLESAPHLTKPSLPQSMCRTTVGAVEKSACVACTRGCRDVDLQRAYWDEVESLSHRRTYYGLFGLIVGFYSFYFLYAGNWGYYASGAWTHEANQLAAVMGPGLYVAGQAWGLPKLFTAPLVLALAVLASVSVWSGIERVYAFAAKRWAAKQGSPAPSEAVLIHHTLSMCAWLCINTFYQFAGRPNFSALPSGVTWALDAAILVLTTLWLVKALRRSPTRYRQESMAVGLRQQLVATKIDFVRLLDGRSVQQLKAGEVYVLARTLPEFGSAQRLAAYRSVIEDLVRTHRGEALGSRVMLREMRESMGVSQEQHSQIMLELRASDGDAWVGKSRTAPENAPSASVVFENYLRRDNFRVAFESLLINRLSPGVSLATVLAESLTGGSVHDLIEVYQIAPEERMQVFELITGSLGQLYERARADLGVLAGHAVLAFTLDEAMLAHAGQWFSLAPSGHGASEFNAGPSTQSPSTQPSERADTNPVRELERAAAALVRSRSAELEPQTRRVLAVLAALGDCLAARTLAQQLCTLSVMPLGPLLRASVSATNALTWGRALAPAVLSVLRGAEQRPFEPAVGLPAFAELIAQAPPLAQQLAQLVAQRGPSAELAGRVAHFLVVLGSAPASVGRASDPVTTVAAAFVATLAPGQMEPAAPQVPARWEPFA